MTVNEPGRSSATPLSRRQLRELERRRALEESGREPDAPGGAVGADAAVAEPDGRADSDSAAHADDAVPGPGSYEELTRELTLDRSLSRRELRALYEAREAQRRASVDTVTAPEDSQSEAEHEALLSGSVARVSAGSVVELPAGQSLTEERDPEPLEPVLHVDGDGDGLITSPVVYGSPPEHWSSADEDLAVSTSTIVLPAPAGRGDAQPSLAEPGEAIVTGTIDLPRELAATGGHPDRYDSAEIDRLIDAADGVDQFESEAAPVRAVSAQPSQVGAVRVAPRRSVTLPIVLASTGGVLLVGVGALLVVALGIR